jgi:hypothetical protein
MPRRIREDSMNKKARKPSARWARKRAIKDLTPKADAKGGGTGRGDEIHIESFAWGTTKVGAQPIFLKISCREE